MAGGFGEGYVPGVIYVSRDPTATARNILAAGSLFRWGLAAYLVEALCDVGLAMAFYVLFRTAHPSLALLMKLLRVVSTTGCGTAQAL